MMMSSLLSLMADLETTYKGSEPSDSVTWKEKDYCAALFSVNHRWHRAQVKSVKDDSAEVTLSYVDSSGSVSHV